MKKEPRTLAELWFMRETSSGWFDGQIKYDNSMREEVVGGIYGITWCARVHPGGVEVVKRVDRYEEINGSNASITGSEDGYISYGSLEEFKASEWWEPTMKAWEGGCTDASWLQSFEVDGEKIEDDVWPEYLNHFIELDVGDQSKDWLGNTKQGREHYPLSISVDRLSGRLELNWNNKEIVYGTVPEIAHAMKVLDFMKRNGIEITPKELTVKIHGSEE